MESARTYMCCEDEQQKLPTPNRAAVRATVQTAPGLRSSGGPTKDAPVSSTKLNMSASTEHNASRYVFSRGYDRINRRRKLNSPHSGESFRSTIREPSASITRIAS